MTMKEKVEKMVREIWLGRDIEFAEGALDTVDWSLTGRWCDINVCVDHGLGTLEFSVLCPLCLEETENEHDSMLVPLDTFIDRLRKFRSACQVWLRSPFKVNPQISADNSLDGIIFEANREIDPDDLDDIRKNLEALNNFLV